MVYNGTSYLYFREEVQIMKKEIFVGNFIYCLLLNKPVMGIQCMGCEHMIQENDCYFCTCDDEDGAD